MKGHIALAAALSLFAVPVPSASMVGCKSRPFSTASSARIAPLPPPLPTPPVLAGTADVPALVAAVRPVVVNITVEHVVRPSDLGIVPFGFPFKGGEEGDEHVFRLEGQGSGFIVDAAGHVITNAHVVEGAEVVRVRLADERELKGVVKGRDPGLDLAVVELEKTENLPVASIGSSDALKVGEYVVAVGNPFGLGHTVTMGIVSAKSRTIGAGPYDDFIQTDAAINPGNSGGPLFNMKGEVVGINTAISAHGRGIGFAIPTEELNEVLPQLLATGHVERGHLGVAVQAMTWQLAKVLGLEAPEGALVSDIEKDGPAERAGIKPQDVILSVDDQRIVHAAELPRILASHAPGSSVEITLRRGNAEKTIEAKLDIVKEAEPMQSRSPAENANGPHGVDMADAADGGALVRRVTPGSPADGELEPGDIVTEVGGKEVSTAKDFDRLTGGKPPFLLKVRREGISRFAALSGP